MVSDYYDAMRSHAKDFLLYGRMRRPLAFPEAGTPAVIQSAWDDGSGLHEAVIAALFAISSRA